MPDRYTMLEPYVIDWLRREQERKERARRPTELPRLDLPLDFPMTTPSESDSEEDEAGGVTVIEL